MRCGRLKLSKSSDKKIVPKDAQFSETNFDLNFTIMQLFSFWDMVDFVLNIHSALGTWTNSQLFYIRGTPLPGPGYDWIESPRQLIIGYHWLSVSESGSQKSLSLQFTMNLSTNSNISQKLKIVKLSNQNQNSFQNIAHLLGGFFFQKIVRIFNDHISKTKNRKIYFSFVSECCTTFRMKKIGSYRWGGGLHVVN